MSFGSHSLSFLISFGSCCSLNLCSSSSISFSSLRHQNREVVQSAVRFVGNITTGLDSQTQLIVDLGGLPKLKSLLSHEHLSIQRESCWAISNITAGTIEQKQVL